MCARRLFIVATILLMLCTSAKAEDPVYFPDANLKAAVEEALSVSDPTPTDMLGLTVLHAYMREIVDLTGLEYATNLWHLRLDHNLISDISALAGLTNLYYLALRDNQISDISALAGLTRLFNLSLPQNQISDISALSGLTRLKYLFVWSNMVVDVSPLSGLTNLNQLHLGYNQVVDVSPLSGLTNLQILWLLNNQIANISAPLRLTNLRTLYLGVNPITDISALAELDNLEQLFLGSSQITDISALSGLFNLRVLDLSHSPINDISTLSALMNLRRLELNNNQISDISVVAGLTNLDMLGLSSNQISDISPLSELNSLQRLNLDSNRIVDISVLSSLTNLRELHLRHNQISDISVLSALMNLRRLELNYNQISDISPLSGLTNLYYLYLQGNPLDCYAYRTAIPLIRENNPGIRIHYPPIPPECLNQPPVADVGEDQTVAVGDIVYLNGSESYDPEGEILGFAWYFDTLPIDSLTVLIDDDTDEPNFIADVEGQYTVSLVVSDGVLGSEPNTVIVTAIPPEDAAEETLIDVNEIIVGLPSESLKNENSANALSNKIDAALTMIEEGRYEEALDKLQNDILKKTDGCASEEEASDNNDWIIDCEIQALVYPLITRAIELLERLVE